MSWSLKKQDAKIKKLKKKLKLLSQDLDETHTDLDSLQVVKEKDLVKLANTEVKLSTY
jgi:5-bromo-4-chloroindolyl phosphate hydrolysis protein